MTGSELGGILAALVTPFTADGSEIDAVALKRHVQRLVSAGVHGLIPGGSTGEFTALTLAERKQLTELCVAFADGQVPVVVGTGALTSRDTVELSRHAAEAGAAAVMVLPPFYDTPSVAQLHQLLRSVHENAGLPIVYYHVPSASGLSLTAQQLADLAQVEGVRYVKDTSGDAVALTELLQAHGARITTFNGWDTLTFYGLAAGARGAGWGAVNLIPELALQLWEAVAVQNDLVRGRELWATIWPVCRLLESHHYPSAVKTGLALVGQPAGPVRAPFGLLEGRARAELAELLSAAGVSVTAAAPEVVPSVGQRELAHHITAPEEDSWPTS